MRYEFEDFKEIIAKLRGEGGCPWDREQTFESMKPCLINETAEALGAIDLLEETGVSEHLCEELGDVLLQVVMLAQIAQEEGRFTMEDVIRGISEKMIRRHPHVFGDVQVENSGQVLDNWEVIKSQEKSGQDPEYKAREKAATKEASRQMIAHLSKMLEENERK